MRLDKVKSQVGTFEKDTHRLPHFAFVDADNMRKSYEVFLDRTNTPNHTRQYLAFSSLFKTHRYDRVYCYSAVEDGAGLPEWLQEIRSQERFVLKLGTLTRKDKTLKQEGVDVKLAIDATRLAYTKTMKSCTLFGADGDFIPLVEALSDSGCIVNIASFNDPTQGRVAPILQAEADSYKRIDGTWVYFNNKFDSTVHERPGNYHDYLDAKTFEEFSVHDEPLEIKLIGSEYLLLFRKGSPICLFGSTDIDHLKVWARFHLKYSS